MALIGYSRQYFLLIPSFIIVLGHNTQAGDPGGNASTFRATALRPR